MGRLAAARLRRSVATVGRGVRSTNTTADRRGRCARTRTHFELRCTPCDRPLPAKMFRLHTLGVFGGGIRPPPFECYLGNHGERTIVGDGRDHFSRRGSARRLFRKVGAGGCGRRASEGGCDIEGGCIRDGWCRAVGGGFLGSNGRVHGLEPVHLRFSGRSLRRRERLRRMRGRFLSLPSGHYRT